MRNLLCMLLFSMFVSSVAFSFYESDPSYSIIVDDDNNEPNHSVIIGEDERVPVTNTNRDPYKYMGMLIYKRNGLSYRCTGTLIGPHHVLTAGHCVWDGKTWSREIYFIPGKNGYKEPYGRHAYRKVVTNRAYYDNKDVDYDYAIVVLRESIGDELGWMDIAPYEFRSSVSLNMAGYPGDKDYGTVWRAYCPVEGDLPRLLLHSCDTSSGMSGSAMYWFDKKTNSRVLYGIHAGTRNSMNRATKISDDVHTALQEWLTKY